MSSRYVHAVLLAVGILLVANPFVIFPHATDPSFEYRAMELPDDGYRLPVEASGRDIEGLDCELGQADWGCVFDAAIAANGSAKFRPDDPATVEHGAWGSETFVYAEGAPRRRVVTIANGTVTARLAPVSWKALLENVSVERDDLSTRERRLLDERNLTTHRPIDWTDQPNPRGGIVVESGDTYHLLWEVSGDRSQPEVGAMVIETARVLGVALGLLVFAVAILEWDSSE